MLIYLAHITGFEDVDTSLQTSGDTKGNGDLEQLKQRLPWNQLSSNNEVSTSEATQLPQVNFFQFLTILYKFIYFVQ